MIIDIPSWSGIAIGAALGAGASYLIPVHVLADKIADWINNKAYGKTLKERQDRYEWVANDIWRQLISEKGFSKEKFLVEIAAYLREEFPEPFRSYLRQLFWTRALCILAMAAAVASFFRFNLNTMESLWTMIASTCSMARVLFTAPSTPSRHCCAPMERR